MVQTVPGNKKIFIQINTDFLFLIKVEEILKGNLNLVPPPSPSVKIQIMGGKVEL